MAPEATFVVYQLVTMVLVGPKVTAITSSRWFFIPTMTVLIDD